MLATPTLLVIDDDAPFRRSLKRVMGRRGFVVHDVGSGRDATAAIDTLRPDMAVIEMRLQSGSGLELIRRMKVQRADTKVLVLTAFGTIESAVAAARLGAVDYLAKPATAALIESVLLGRARELADARFLKPEEQEFNYLLTIFEAHDRNLSETARAIGMHRRTLQRILRRHGIAPTVLAKDEPPSELRRLRRLIRLWSHLLEGGEAPLPVLVAAE